MDERRPEMPGGEVSYRFTYTEEGTYGHVVALVDRLALPPGLVVDLGCGYGALAEPLMRRGFAYLGLDVDRLAVADLVARGLEAHPFDLWDRRSGAGPLGERLVDLVAGRPVVAVLLLDVVEHCPMPAAFLDDLAAALRTLDRPPLVVSIPNVAHVDLAAKLLTGRFEYTPTGLLDRNHLQLFTERRVTDELAAHGWRTLAVNDLELRRSDQYDPHHPLLAEGTPAAAFVRRLREGADSNAYVNQFIRAFTLDTSPPVSQVTPTPTPTPIPTPTPTRTSTPSPTPTPALASAAGGGTGVPFLSVVVRTQGQRMTSLREALLCLAAQDDDDFEVELVVHDPTGGRHDEVARLVGALAPDVSGRIRIHRCGPGGRGRPLNAGLDEARGRYVAFLDDDDLVTADWVATFHRAADADPGKIIRSLAVLQDVARVGGPPTSAYEPRSPFREAYRATFDFVEHLVANQTPIHTFAVPRRLAADLGLRFDESLPVTEDWDFLLHAAQLADVRDTGVVTGIYHWWVDGSGSAGAASAEVWTATRRAILERLTSSPCLLPPAAARQLVTWAEENVANRTARAEAEARAEAAVARRDAIERSRFWRATGPLRRGAAIARRAAAVAGRATRPTGP